MDRIPFNFATFIVKEGLSANEGLAQLRAMGHGVRRADWLDMVRTVRDNLDEIAASQTRTGNRRPYRKEIMFMATAGVTGFMQHVNIWVKDNDTGEIFPRPYSIRTDDLMTHDDAIETALDRYADSAEHYGQKILGATYMTTFELGPEQP